MNAEPASVEAPSPVLVSLSGLHGFCGYEFGSHIGSPNHGAMLSSPYLVTLPVAVGCFRGSRGSFTT